jgi:4-diphosphocytidyl-2-C-methyl-D-erythritol kinase
MNLRQNESPRTVPARAKLNLFLDVLGRRPDGYHELQTLLVPVQLYDSLTFSAKPAGDPSRPAGISLESCVQPTLSAGLLPELRVPDGPENLVIRALELLRERSGCERGAHVRLIKRIPVAAGMGGGSSDAAAALRLANRGWGIHWSYERLTTLAAELGSDVPFFLSSGPAVCRGRGEVVEPICRIPPLQIVVVKPPVALSTADVYRAVDHLPIASDVASDSLRPSNRIAGLVETLRRGDLRNLGQWMVNRLQAAAATLSPWVERVRTAFAQLDFLGHQLSGSGSAYFGVCRHAQHARRLATILRTQQLGSVFITHSCR